MKIQFSHIGSIKKMAFELKPGLTLFCGPNNTGKTYAAYAIFSVLHGLKTIDLNWLTDEDYIQLESKGMVEIDFTALTQSGAFLDQVSSILSNQLASDFDAPKSFFAQDCIRINELYSGLKADDIGSDTWLMGPLMFKAAISNTETSKKLTVSLLRQGTPSVDAKLDKSFVIETFNHLISKLVATIRIGRPYVLTAERSAISLFSKELAASRSGFIAPPAARPAILYPLPIRISLGIAEDLSNIAKKFDPQHVFQGYANALEQKILGGSIEIGEYGEIFYTPTSSSKLHIHLTASMIKSLASLVIYLRYQAKKEDVLIIDEPELNLHPANQRKIARFLCTLVNAGIEVIISSHSDYIIREINNAILLANPKMEEIRKRHGYVPRELLEPELVSVMMFDVSGEPKQIPIDQLGFAVDSIDEEINTINQISDDIMWELEKAEEE